MEIKYTKTIKLLLIPAILFAVFLGFSGEADAENTLSYYKGVYDNEYKANKNTWDWIASTGEGLRYYNGHGVLDSTLSIYEATGDTTYLEIVLTWAETMVSKATIRDNNGNKNWKGIWNSPYSATPISYQLEDLQGSVELSRLVRIIWDNPTLKAKYWTRASVVYDFIRLEIVEKWLTKRGSLSCFEDDFDNTSKQLDDKPVIMIRILNHVYHISGSSAYGEIVTRWAGKYKNRFSDYNGGKIWDYNVPNPYGGYSSMDTAHGIRYPATAIDLYNDGISFTTSDIRGLATLFTGTIWNSSHTSPQFTNWIDGYNGVFRGVEPWANGLIYTGWVNLGRYNETAQQVGHNTLVAILAGVRNPSLDAMNSYLGKAGFAGNLAKNLLGSQLDTVPPAAPDGLTVQ